MKIVIDGPNNVGKSTIIENLNKVFNYSVEHIVKDATYYRFKLALSNENVILDRGPISELVYSEIYGRTPNLTIQQVKELLSHQSVHSYVIIKPKEEIYKNYIRKHEETSEECVDSFIDKELELFKKYAILTDSVITSCVHVGALI